VVIYRHIRILRYSLELIHKETLLREAPTFLGDRLHVEVTVDGPGDLVIEGQSLRSSIRESNLTILTVSDKYITHTIRVLEHKEGIIFIPKLWGLGTGYPLFHDLPSRSVRLRWGILQHLLVNVTHLLTPLNL